MGADAPARPPRSRRAGAVSGARARARRPHRARRGPHRGVRLGAPLAGRLPAQHADRGAARGGPPARRAGRRSDQRVPAAVRLRGARLADRPPAAVALQLPLARAAGVSLAAAHDGASPRGCGRRRRRGRAVDGGARVSATGDAHSRDERFLRLAAVAALPHSGRADRQDPGRRGRRALSPGRRPAAGEGGAGAAARRPAAVHRAQPRGAHGARHAHCTPWSGSRGQPRTCAC